MLRCLDHWSNREIALPTLILIWFGVLSSRIYLRRPVKTTPSKTEYTHTYMYPKLSLRLRGFQLASQSRLCVRIQVVQDLFRDKRVKSNLTSALRPTLENTTHPPPCLWAWKQLCITN